MNRELQTDGRHFLAQKTKRLVVDGRCRRRDEQRGPRVERVQLTDRVEEVLAVEQRLPHRHEHDLHAIDLVGVHPLRLQEMDRLCDDLLSGEVANEVVTCAAEPTAHRAAALRRTTDDRSLVVGRVLVQHRLGDDLVRRKHELLHVGIGRIDLLDVRPHRVIGALRNNRSTGCAH